MITKELLLNEIELLEKQRTNAEAVFNQAGGAIQAYKALLKKMDTTEKEDIEDAVNKIVPGAKVKGVEKTNGSKRPT